MAVTPASRDGSAVAFREFIVKIHDRCDLACDYCYVYTMADQRWRHRPRSMSRQTMRRVSERIHTHARTHDLAAIDIVLHGGEPLLAGYDDIEFFVRTLRSGIPDGHLRVQVQTNGLHLDTRFLDLFQELGIVVGVSLDGGPAAHDRHRRHANGHGSYAQVADSLRRLGTRAYRNLFGGILCTINLRNDPVTTYRSLLEFAPPALDLLLPHGNWSVPPSGRNPDSVATPYADWLTAVFDQWYSAPQRETRIRLFDEIINVLLGGHSGVEGIGTDPSRFIVVESDGAIAMSDALASAYEGASTTGLCVDDDDFDSVLGLPAFRETLALPTACQACSVRRICGGGLFAHRYRSGHGFDNPSVYCPDIYRLIRLIHDRVSTDIDLLRRQI